MVELSFEKHRSNEHVTGVTACYRVPTGGHLTKIVFGIFERGAVVTPAVSATQKLRPEGPFAPRSSEL